MFSRPGKSTSYQYLCFHKKKEEEENDVVSIVNSKNEKKGSDKIMLSMLDANASFDIANDEGLTDLEKIEYL